MSDVKGDLLAYVDDFLITPESDVVDSLQKHIGEMWKTSTQTTISAKHPGTIKYLSIDISIEQSGRTTLGQHQYCQEMLEKWNMDSCKGTNSINLDKEEFDVGAQDEEENYPGRESDCLLYTSPSPRDLLKSRMPSSA